MTDHTPEQKWQVRLMGPRLHGLDKLHDMGLPDLSRLPWMNRPLLPAEIGDGLRDAMLARENHLEDVNYMKIVPNHYLVEVGEVNFARNFRPIQDQIIKGWTNRLLEELVTANSRQGRKEFRFGGRLRMEVRPTSDLKDNEARILSRIDPDAGQSPRASRPRGSGVTGGAPIAAPRQSPPKQPSVIQRPLPAAAQRPPAAHPADAPATLPEPPGGLHAGGTGPGAAVGIASAFLELVPSGQRWALYPGINTIGRSDSAQIFLDMAIIQEKRLVSGMHAYIIFENGECTLYDGSPDGRPSANGTYVNLRRVPQAGYRLQNGDAIVLAAVDPLYPRSDTPGVVTFYFWAQRRG